MVAFAAVAVGLLAAPTAHAATVPADATAYYIGDDGGLWSYGRAADGRWSTAARVGPARLAPAGAPVAATRPPGGPSNVFFVGVDGSVLVGCPQLSQPVALTGAGFARPGAPITATVADGRILVSSRFVHFAHTYRMEISNPCSPPVSLVLVNPPPKYSGGGLASAGLADGGSGVFYVDGSGALWAQWRDRTGLLTDQQLTVAETATPGGGIAVVSTEGAGTERGVLTLFFTGHDGRVYVAHPVEGRGLAGAPQPNTTGAANVPDGAELSVATGTSSVAIGYVASDGTLTTVTLTTAGAWQRTTPLTGAAFTTAGSSSAISAASDDGYDVYCGNGRRAGHVHGPIPGHPWTVSGPANVPSKAGFAAG
ncbi:hypothetical protein AB0945_17630 [Streptomyces sp. NPDC005474]|uniref:hypothetical protein n=1 Tax=Streptomyces sp. NPDC005474 TaxID=3154878 RepID=UPI003454EAB3